MNPINELSQRIHQVNKKWWQNIDTGEPLQRNKRELLMLVISELAEALEGERKDLMDDKLPHRKMAEVEMADAYIRILDFAAGFGYMLRDGINWPFPPNNKAEALFCIACSITQINHASRETTETMLSVALSEVRSYCEKFDYDLMGALEEKLAFNATRSDHTDEARLIAHGKQF